MREPQEEENRRDETSHVFEGDEHIENGRIDFDTGRPALPIKDLHLPPSGVIGEVDVSWQKLPRKVARPYVTFTDLSKD